MREHAILCGFAFAILYFMMHDDENEDDGDDDGGSHDYNSHNFILLRILYFISIKIQFSGRTVVWLTFRVLV